MAVDRPCLSPPLDPGGLLRDWGSKGVYRTSEIGGGGLLLSTKLQRICGHTCDVFSSLYEG